MTPAARATDGAYYRSVLGHFATGVTVVTADADGVPVGVTCQSFSALSLDPPLVAVFAGTASRSWPHIRRSGIFVVNVLAADQEATGRLFASSGADRFGATGWQRGPSGAPVLDGVLAWIECGLDTEVEAGDHVVLIGRVLDLEVARPDADPLLFFRGSFGTVGGGASS